MFHATFRSVGNPDFGQYAPVSDRQHRASGAEGCRQHHLQRPHLASRMIAALFVERQNAHPQRYADPVS